jgi:hypothetical protein
MKSIAFVLLLVVGGLALLRTDFTPWRLMTTDELEEMKATAAKAAAEEATAAATAAAAKAKPTGDWMRDPKYHTSLDKGAGSVGLSPVTH